MTDIKTKRQQQTEKGREEAQKTLEIKSLLSFVSKKSKKATYKNRLIDELLNNGIYYIIYNKYIDYLENTKTDDINLLEQYLTEKEYKILELLDFIEPDEIETKKEGYYIQEKPINI